jgi:hypothetical protein
MVDDDGENVQNIHKEEAQARISSDRNDRNGIRHKLEMSINPHDPASHPEGIVNIVNGRVGPATVNAQDSLEVGREQMSEFERTWPDHFYDTINKKITTMAVTKRSVRLVKQTCLIPTSSIPE